MPDLAILKEFLQIMTGPFGASALLGVFLWVYDKRTQKHQEAERESRERLSSTFETALKTILEKSEATQSMLAVKAENAEKLCEARYELLLKEVLRNKP